MDINLSNIGFRSATFGIGEQMSAEGRKAESQKPNGLKLSGSENLQVLDLLGGSEPVAEVPETELVRDDKLGRLVASAFCLPAPSMPDFAS